MIYFLTTGILGTIFTPVQSDISGNVKVCKTTGNKITSFLVTR